MLCLKPLHCIFYSSQMLVNSLNDSWNAFRILMKMHILSEGSLGAAALSHHPAAPALVLSNKGCASRGKVGVGHCERSHLQ